MSPHRLVLDAPEVFTNASIAKNSGNHIPKHIQSTAPTVKYQKSYVEITIAVFFGRTRYHPGWSTSFALERR